MSGPLLFGKYLDVLARNLRAFIPVVDDSMSTTTHHVDEIEGHLREPAKFILPARATVGSPDNMESKFSH
jgi:hypothetical protein